MPSDLEGHDLIKQEWLTRWAIRLLDATPDMALDTYLGLVKTDWPVSPEYKGYKHEAATGEAGFDVA